MKNKIYNGIMGLIVGDALGVPFEFKPRGTFECNDMIGFGTYRQPAGTWSDDSSMTIATLDSIAKSGGKIVPQDIMQRFADWYFLSKYTPYGNTFDVGHTTAKAICAYMREQDVGSCGRRAITDNGNGALMRILPLALMNNVRQRDIEQVGALTHAHEISKQACVIYSSIVNIALNTTEPLEKIVKMIGRGKNAEFCRIENVGDLKMDDIKSTGYVVDTLEAALWSVLNANSYKEAVLTAVNLGEDTDTIAAIAGGLAGIIFGDIPEEWLIKIAKREYIESVIDAFTKVA